jgi:hypothetical protein
MITIYEIIDKRDNTRKTSFASPLSLNEQWEEIKNYDETNYPSVIESICVNIEHYELRQITKFVCKICGLIGVDMNDLRQLCDVPNQYMCIKCMETYSTCPQCKYKAFTVNHVHHFDNLCKLH